MTLAVMTPHGPADDAAIAQAEQQLGFALPTAYRRFLTTVGGGHTGDLTVPGTKGMGVLLEIFKPEDVVKQNVIWGRESGFIAYIPHDYILIGDGGGGGLSLRVRGEDVGSVWWADFDKAGEFEEEEPHEEIMVRLADDFDAFLNLF